MGSKLAIVAHPEAALRKGLGELLSLRIPGLAVQTAGDEPSLFALCGDERPSVVIIAARLSDRRDLASLVDATRAELQAQVPIILLGGRDDNLAILLAINRWIGKDVEPIADDPLDHHALLQAVGRALVTYPRDEEGRPRYGLGSLQPNELQVLDLVLSGRTSRSIAESMGVTPRAVEQTRRRLLEKLGAENTIDMALIATGVRRPPWERF